MKSLKLLLINALTLIVGIGLLSGSFSQRDAQAARFEQIPALEIQKLGNFRGQYVTVLYAVGSKPFIATKESQVQLSQVKEARSVYVTGDKVALPSVQVEKEGFRPSYNMIVIVVSPLPNFSWVNSDGTVPQGMILSSNQTSSKVQIVNKTTIDNFVTAQGASATLAIELKL